MILKHLIKKEFLQIRRNAFLPRLIVMFPIVMMCVMPWVMNMEVKNVVVDVVDNDRSPLSQRLVHSVEASRYFVFNGQKDSYAAALKEIESSRADVVLVIPPHYSRDVAQGKQPQVLIAANAVNGVKGAMGSAYLSQIVTAQVSPSVKAMQDKVATLTLYNKHMNYKLFMIPALFALVMMLMTGFLPTLNIVGEKEAGTIEQINVTPVPK
ncbi:MAG: ABC transporter permease, partial [Muribaculaceae bacterium]|nr:ABC transporter permease [Muribaculaceae bacterium]